MGGAKNGRLLYAATPDGIFVSGDSGATWIQTAPIVAPGLASYGRTLTVNAISLDPQDPSTLLVATNAGVFGSDSGGQDGWGERNNGLAVSASGFVMASWVSFSPVNPLVAYATTRKYLAAFKSNLSGRTGAADRPFSSDCRYVKPGWRHSVRRRRKRNAAQERGRRAVLDQISAGAVGRRLHAIRSKQFEYDLCV